MRELGPWLFLVVAPLGMVWAGAVGYFWLGVLVYAVLLPVMYYWLESNQRRRD